MNTHLVRFAFLCPMLVSSSACVNVAGDFGKGGDSGSTSSTSAGGDGGGGGSTSSTSSGGDGGSTSSTSSGGDGGSTSSTTSSSTSSTTETGPMCGDALACDTAADCPASGDECAVPTCDPAGCCAVAFVAAGTVTSGGQIAADCKVAVCDGFGATIVIKDDADVSDDGNPCTADTCSNGDAAHPAQAGACSLGANVAVCGDPAGAAKGTCVQCNGDADCPASTLCEANACTPVTLDFGGAWGYVAGGVLVPNPATGAESCPITYTDTKVLHTAGVDWPFHFCSRPHQPGAEQLLEFGGMWGYVNAAKVNNPITGAASCPAGYTDQKVLDTSNVDWPLHVCYKMHSQGTTPEHGFAGMWGYVNNVATLNPATGASSCPAGATGTQVFGTTNVDPKVTFCWY